MLPPAFCSPGKRWFKRSLQLALRWMQVVTVLTGYGDAVGHASITDSTESVNLISCADLASLPAIQLQLIGLQLAACQLVIASSSNWISCCSFFSMHHFVATNWIL